MSTTVKEIRIYPVKSCHAQFLRETNVVNGSLEHDREYTLFDPEKKRTITQNNEPRLALVYPRINTSNGELKISIPSKNKSLILKPPKNPKKIVVTFLNNRKIEMQDMGDEPSQFFSNFLGYKVRFVKQLPKTRIVENEINDDFHIKNPRVNIQFREIGDRPLKLSSKVINDFPSLANRSSVSLVSVKTVEALNDNTKKFPMTVDLFRTNIVVEGCQANDEDFWRTFSVGKLKFQYIRGVPRCCLVMVVDQENGKVDYTPFKVFKEKKGYKGQNANVGALLTAFKGYENGKIKVGDEITVLSRVKNLSDHSQDNINVLIDQNKMETLDSNLNSKFSAKKLLKFVPLVSMLCFVGYKMYKNHKKE